MTGLRNLFDEAVDAPPPARPLSPDDLFTAGRVRSRRRAATAVGAAALAVTAVIGLGNWLTGSTQRATDLPATAPTPTVGVPHPGEVVQWAGAADRRHLYLSFPACPRQPCVKTTVQVVGSDDRGRTWTDRGSEINATELAVLGPRTLVATAPGSPGRLMVSTDGGRHWRAAPPSAPVSALPPGGAVICWAEGAEGPCLLHAIDPADGRLSPLATQPGLTVRPTPLDGFGAVVDAGGRLWVAGTDPVTGRPAVAVSADAGRRWSAHVFAKPAGCTPVRCGAPHLADAGGGAVRAVISDAARRIRTVYHGSAAGDWDAEPRATMPYAGERAFAGSYVTADGQHLLAEVRADREAGQGSELSYVPAAAGADRGEVALDGLPSAVRPVRRTPDGWFYTYSHPEPVLYGSDDGRRWSPVILR
jgi:hypothetical protein